MRTEMDNLVLGSWLLEKERQPELAGAERLAERVRAGLGVRRSGVIAEGEIDMGKLKHTGRLFGEFWGARLQQRGRATEEVVLQ